MGRRAHAATHLGDSGRCIRRIPVRARRRHRQCGPADHQSRTQYFAVRFDLDCECLPVGHRHLPPLLFNSGRPDRLSQDLPDGPDDLYGRFGRLHLRPLVRHAGRGTCLSRLRSSRRDQCQHNTDPYYLSQTLSGAWHGTECHGCCRFRSCRPHHCRRHPLLCAMALAVRHQHTGRNYRLLIKLQLPAGESGQKYRTAVRLA